MIIPFLTSKWTLLTDEQVNFLRPRADLRFRQGHWMGWGRRFSILLLEERYYGIDSAYGYHHLDHLVAWVGQQDVVADNLSNFLNQGMKELGL